MMKCAVVIAGMVACTSTPPDAPDEADGCAVDLAGNFTEAATAPANCPTLAAGAGATQGDTLLHFAVPSQALGASFAIDLDLGAQPGPGSYGSETTALWSALGVEAVAPGGACVFLAGNNTTPSGDFQLALDALDAGGDAHGSLALVMAVLPRVEDDGRETDCGAGTTEMLALRF